MVQEIFDTFVLVDSLGDMHQVAGVGAKEVDDAI